METSEGFGSYYSILGVSSDSSDEEIRRAYKKLAMQWHPDKWTRTPTLLSEAKRKFQQIQEAYSVLSDRRKRAMYDAGLYDPENDEDEVEGFADFLQEMVSLVEDVKKEGKNYSMEDLQSMFWEMARGFDSPDWCSFPQNPVCEMARGFNSPDWFSFPQNPVCEMARGFDSPDWLSIPQNPVCESPQWFSGPLTFNDSGTSGVAERNSYLNFSGLEMYGTSHVCR